MATLHGMTGAIAAPARPPVAGAVTTTAAVPAVVAVVAMLAATVALAAAAMLLAPVLGWPLSAPHGLPLGRVLLTGPLTETLAMLALAVPLTRALSRRRHDERAAMLVCTAIVGLSFGLSHLAQQGAASLLSLPMALWLSLLAARAAQPGTTAALGRGCAGLFALHGLYNAALLVMAG